MKWVTAPFFILAASIFFFEYTLAQKDPEVGIQNTPSLIAPHLVFSGTPDHSISPTQIAFERKHGASVGRVFFNSLASPGFVEKGSAFLVSDKNLLITSRHIIAQLIGQKNQSSSFDPKISDAIMKTVQVEFFHEPHPIVVTARHLEYCSSDYDFCIIRMNSIPNIETQNVQELGDILAPLKFASSQNGLLEGTKVTMISEGSNELQATSGFLLAIQPDAISGCLYNSDKNSGSPILNQNGEVISVHYIAFGKDPRCPVDNEIADFIPSSVILTILREKTRSLYDEIIK